MPVKTRFIGSTGICCQCKKSRPVLTTYHKNSIASDIKASFAMASGGQLAWGFPFDYQ